MNIFYKNIGANGAACIRSQSNLLGVGELNFYKGQPIMMISSGPSAVSWEQEIKEKARDCWVICGVTTLPWLYQIGVAPDMIVVHDSSSVLYDIIKSLKDFEFIRNTSIWALSVYANQGVRTLDLKWTVSYIPVNHISQEVGLIEGLFNPCFKRPQQSLVAYGSTANIMWEIVATVAPELAAKDIHMYGFDFGYEEGLSLKRVPGVSTPVFINEKNSQVVGGVVTSPEQVIYAKNMALQVTVSGTPHIYGKGLLKYYIDNKE